MPHTLLLDIALINIRQDIEHGRKERMYDIALVFVLVRFEHGLDQQEQLSQLRNVVVAELHAGPLPQPHVYGQRRRNVDRNIADKLLRKRHNIGPCILAALDRLYNTLVMHVQQRIRFQVILLGPDAHASRPLHHHQRDEPVDQRRAERCHHVVDEQNHKIVRQIDRLVDIVAYLRNREFVYIVGSHRTNRFEGCETPTDLIAQLAA